VTSGDFLRPLGIQAAEVVDTVADRGEWAAGMVYFAVIRFSDFANVDTSTDAGAQFEAFFAAIVEAFRKTGQFLDRRSPEITAAMRASGHSLRIFVDIRMDVDQMELELPPELLAACGRHSLGVYIISNDIPADEVLAAGQGQGRCH
jgi:hypothetical protein